MKISNNEAIFEVIGGLGNQLFGLSAGIYFEKKHHKRLKVSLREVDKGITAHGVSIANLDLPCELVEVTYKKRQLSRFIRRVVFKMDRTFSKNSSFSRRLLGIYRSNTTGYDSVLDSNIAQRRIQGYFQSRIYADALKDSLGGKSIQVKNESTWLYAMKLKAISEKPVVLHVRRGDYRNQMNDFGMLSSKYYEKAISLVRESFPSNPIWVFSDELNETRKEFTESFEENFEWILPPPSSTSEESFILMQFGIAHIISNSTFSWWSAYASQNSSLVVAPNPWMKSVKEPENLIPLDWVRINSDWL